MGKYPNSDIHAKYSDYHWGLTKIHPKYKRLYTADIDRLWIEYDFTRNEILAVIDVKYLNSKDGLTSTEEGIYRWFEKKNVRIFIVFITKDFKRFEIMDLTTKERACFDEIGYADWLLSLRRLKDNNNSFDLAPTQLPLIFQKNEQIS